MGLLWRRDTEERNRERERIRENALVNRELFDRALQIVHDEAGALASEGRVTIETTLDAARDGGSIVVRPRREEATGIELSIFTDVVGFSTGSAGACNEIWTTVSEDWERTLRQMIGCVRDGRYSEKVKRGWFFPVKVDMRFEGVPSGPEDRDPDFTPGYASVLMAGEPAPPIGHFTFDPW